MTGKVAVLIIHGMGSQKANFAEATQNEVNRRISNRVDYTLIIAKGLIDPSAITG